VKPPQVYEPFFGDFGPLNLGHTYNFCKRTNDLLQVRRGFASASIPTTPTPTPNHHDHGPPPHTQQQQQVTIQPHPDKCCPCRAGSKEDRHCGLLLLWSAPMATRQCLGAGRHLAGAIPGTNSGAGLCAAGSPAALRGVPRRLERRLAAATHHPGRDPGTAASSWVQVSRHDACSC